MDGGVLPKSPLALCCWLARMPQTRPVRRGEERRLPLDDRASASARKHHEPLRKTTVYGADFAFGAAWWIERYVARWERLTTCDSAATRPPIARVAHDPPAKQSFEDNGSRSCILVQENKKTAKARACSPNALPFGVSRTKSRLYSRAVETVFCPQCEAFVQAQARK